MRKIATLSPKDRSDLFTETAANQGLSPAVIEKDFWTCWVLDRLFTSDFFKDKILFKGGTSLSKVFGLIERFSEDIDLILDWNEVIEESPELDRSKTKQDRFNKATNQRAQAYLRDRFLPAVSDLINGIATAGIDPQTPDVIDIVYPGAFKETYLRPEIRLEIGPLAAWLPNAEYAITPYAAEAFPKLFDEPDARVKAILAERTFWEKATILHQEAHRPPDKPQPPRYSRHYYDLVRMVQSDRKRDFLASTDLLPDVAAFKQKFYPSNWARYDLARIGTLKLVPPEHVVTTLRRDYAEMQIMIFGEAPKFDEILEVLEELETEINQGEVKQDQE